MKFVLATFNRNKMRELGPLFTRAGHTLVGLYEFSGASVPAETGTTLEQNARVKAQAAAAHTELPAIADDTGLEVDALDGRPGVRSARYAGPGATDADNTNVLLEQLARVDPPRRTARFRSVMIACFPDGRERIGQGVLEGVITLTPRGQGGFGYDAVFEVASLGRTLAELSLEEKNALSHRGRAAEDLIRQLAEV